MTDDIKLAFAHPSERSVAMANPDIRDRISLRDHIRDVDIGAFQAERGVTQRVSFNVVVEVGLPELDAAVQSDDVDKILSYDAITDAIDRGLGAERLNLLETLAVRIAEDILTSPLTARVFIRIEKLDRGSGELGVEIMRDKVTTTPRDVETQVKPLVAYLAQDVIADPKLGQVLDRLEAAQLPLILCVGADFSETGENHPMVQRRIDLLAIEQTAWHLAGLDPRCVVVSTRTELDWAMKNGQICVWAPSKLVLDATEEVIVSAVDPIQLADWFAIQFNAEKTLKIGTADNSFAANRKADMIALSEFISPA